MLSMPRGVDPLYVLKAAREFAKDELADHKYVMVLHDHQANPHVHLSVRAESRHGHRLNPRKADLARWRQVFAEKLREWGIEAEASPRSVRGPVRGNEPLWRIKARQDQRLQRAGAVKPGRGRSYRSNQAKEAWAALAKALAASERQQDRELGVAIGRFVGVGKEVTPHRTVRTVTQELGR